MKILLYSIRDFERPFLLEAKPAHFRVDITGLALSPDTVKTAEGYDIVSVFTGDTVSEPVLEQLHAYGIHFIAVRATGCENVDLAAAARLGIRVATLPPYPPQAVAEHTIALILALNRRLVAADRQVQAYNFSIGNLVGFNLSGKTVGIVGTGRVGRIVARILADGFGCHLLAYDTARDPDLSAAVGVTYTDLDTLCRQSAIITLHVPLTEGTRHLIDEQRIRLMKKGVMLINTSRGAVVHTLDVLKGLQQGQIGYFGADVYEYEHDLFFHDYSDNLVKADPVLNRFLEMPNVLITPHQSFATRETLTCIAEATIHNLEAFVEQGTPGQEAAGRYC